MSLWQFVEFHTKFDNVSLFDIFLHHKRNKVVKHGHRQTSVVHDWLNQSSWNKYGHAAKITDNAPIYIMEVLIYISYIGKSVYLLLGQTSYTYEPGVIAFKRLLVVWERNGSTSGPTPWQLDDDDDDDDDEGDDDYRHRNLILAILNCIFYIIQKF